MSAIFSKAPAGASSAETSAARRAMVSTAIEAPVKFWAAIGVVFFIFSFYIWGAWLASGPVQTHAPLNLDQAEQLRQTIFVWIERVSFLLLIWALYHFTFRPLIRERRLTNDGIAMATMPILWFQEPIGHYASPWWSYSTYFTSWGNWAGQLPGVMSANVGVIPEPIPFSMACYPTLLGVPVLIILWAMRKYKEKFPSAGAASVMCFAFVCGLIYDFVCEHFPARAQIWSFQRVVESWSLWGGHYYQYPIYEGIFFGGMAVAMASTLYFVNDKGQTFVDRGVEKVKAGPVGKAALRFFAMLGLFELFFLFLYNAPIQFISMHADPMPEDMPAHLRPGLCGEGTEYVCASKDLPIIVSKEALARIEAAANK